VEVIILSLIFVYIFIFIFFCFVFKDEEDFGFDVKQHSNCADLSAEREPSLGNTQSCKRKPNVKTGLNTRNDNYVVCYTTLDVMYNKILHFFTMSLKVVFELRL
jgi:hypothetical protein